jgi:plasmid stabilization system protein ParE
MSVARIELAPEVADDFDRILAHLGAYETADAASRLQDIIAAIDVLQRNPLIGRVDTAGHRELVIGRGARGYVALYRYEAAIDTVFVLAMRSQREAGYVRP